MALLFLQDVGQDGFCELSTQLLKQALNLSTPKTGKPNTLELVKKVLRRHGKASQGLEDWPAALDSHFWHRMLKPNTSPIDPRTGVASQKDEIDDWLDTCIAVSC